MTFFLIFAGFIGIILYRYQQHIRKGYEIAGRKTAPIRTWALPVPQRYREILTKYFLYYQQLSPSNKNKFERKLASFVYSKKFIPRNIQEVTLEAKVLIAASAVQLTFGLPDVYLEHFDKILVYPNDYYSSITKKFHKGEVNPRFGIIVLSWQSFVEGYIQPNDSKNVGLHEMAHALRLENIVRSEVYHFFDDQLLEQFDTLALKVCNISSHEEAPFFREYACTNKHEFFSVAVENFFERPQAFKDTWPQLYLILSKLLSQDPLTLNL